VTDSRHGQTDILDVPAEYYGDFYDDYDHDAIRAEHLVLIQKMLPAGVTLLGNGEVIVDLNVVTEPISIDWREIGELTTDEFTEIVKRHDLWAALAVALKASYAEQFDVGDDRPVARFTCGFQVIDWGNGACGPVEDPAVATLDGEHTVSIVLDGREFAPGDVWDLVDEASAKLADYGVTLDSNGCGSDDQLPTEVSSGEIVAGQAASVAYPWIVVAATVTTVPDNLVHDELGGTRGVINRGTAEIDVVRLPYSEDKAEWERLADAALAESGWARTGAWVEDGDSLSAQVEQTL
jgi:hypothetical protein